MGSTYEECRAECVGLYLSLDKEVLRYNFLLFFNLIMLNTSCPCRIFGHEGDVANDVLYVNWMSLIWNGVGKALEMYQPDTKSWLQVKTRWKILFYEAIINQLQIRPIHKLVL